MTPRLRVLLPLLLACLLVTAAVVVQGFDMTTVESDLEGVQELKDAIAVGWKPDRAAAKAAVENAMARGWWELSHQLIQHARSLRMDMTASVYQRAATIRRQLKSLEESLRGQAGVATGIAPAFQWGQSPDSIFLSVKFAHKWDTPATLGCKAEKVDFTANKTIFAANCAAKRKKFMLNLETLRAIDPEESSWTMSSVGRAMLTLKKAVPGTWPRLLKSRQKPANLHIWWSMKEKYEEENKAFDKAEAARKKEAASADAAAAAADAGTSKPVSGVETAVAGGEGAAAAAEAAAVAAVEEQVPAGPSEEELRVEAVEKKFKRLRKAAEEEALAKKAEADAKARAEKKAVMEDAKLRKEAIAAAAAKEKAAVDEATAAKLQELVAAMESELAAAGSGSGSGSAEL